MILNLADKIGISPGALSKFLTGKGKLPKKSWKKIEGITHGAITTEEVMESVLSEIDD